MKIKIIVALCMLVCLPFFTPSAAVAQNVSYEGDVEFNVLVPRKYSEAALSLMTTHGAKFNKPGLFLGVGAGAGFLIDPEYGKFIIPLYGDIRKDFRISSRVSTFIDAKIGYTFGAYGNDYDGDSSINYGFCCSPTLGIRYALNRRYGLKFSVGYTYQDTKFEWLGMSDNGFGRHVRKGTRAVSRPVSVSHSEKLTKNPSHKID